MSVSPPPGGASGLWVEEVRWNESPPSVERWTKLSCVDVPRGPDSQMLPLRSTWIIGSPSVRTGSATVLGPKAIPPVGCVGFGTGPPGVNARVADPWYSEPRTRNGTMRTSYTPGAGNSRKTASDVVPPAPDEATWVPSEL